jgi:phosphatidylglycerol:prolipoprotein diacylglycerol transferase
MYPVLFKIGHFQVHSFGVMMVLAFVAAIYLTQIRAERYGLGRVQVSDCCFWALVAGVLGARVAFIIQEPSWFAHHPAELFSLQFRGLTSFGGLIFGAGAVLIWARKHRVPIWSVLDLAAPAFVIGHAIGRIGCLMNGCCFGGECSPGLPWGIHVEDSSVLHHPAQAYDSLMNFVAVGILLWREKVRLAPGSLVGIMLILHGFTRIIYEFWRAGTEEQVQANLASSTYWGTMPFTQAQAMAAVLVIIGGLILIVSRQPRSVLIGGLKSETGHEPAVGA